MKYIYITIFIVAAAVLSGCGTLLAISEASVTKGDPNALVVNRPATYAVKIIPIDGRFEQIKPPEVMINGVDHDRVITLDVRRMPFSSGKLSVTLNDSQLIKEVELTSKSGADRAANAVKSSFDTRTEIEKIREDAKKAAKNEQ